MVSLHNREQITPALGPIGLRSTLPSNYSSHFQLFLIVELSKYLSDGSPVVAFNLYLYPRNVMSGIMMTVCVRLLHPYIVFLLTNPKSGKLNYMHQLTSKRQKCPDVQQTGKSTTQMHIKDHSTSFQGMPYAHY